MSAIDRILSVHWRPGGWLPLGVFSFDGSVMAGLILLAPTTHGAHFRGSFAL
jgi:hypothetical protein